MGHETAGSVFRAARLRAGLSVSELAKRTGLNEQTIRNAEAGRRRTRISTARKIASGCGTPTAELLVSADVA